MRSTTAHRDGCNVMVDRVQPRWERIQRAHGAASYAGYRSESEFLSAVRSGGMPSPFEHSGADAWDITEIDNAIDALKASVIRQEPGTTGSPSCLNERLAGCSCRAR